MELWTVRQWDVEVGANEQYHVKHILDIPEAKRASNNQLNLVVCGLDSSVAYLQLDGIEDMILVPHNLSLQFNKLRDPAMPCPFHPACQFTFSSIHISHLQ